MQFAQPIWFAAGALACALLAWSWRRFDAGQRAALAKFAAARLLPRLTTSISPVRRRLKRGLLLAGVALLFTALARPQSGFEMRETHRRGLELVFAVDTSKSMLAQDVKPDRLTRARLGVTDLLDRLRGDGVGLIAFAGTAFLQCPVTLDYNAFRESLNALDTSTIPAGGTNIAGAICEAEAVFEERGTAEKILVLLTDGEDLDGDGITAAEAAAKKGVKIFTVGVGSNNGELVPVPAANGGTEFARDANGQLVKSRLDETVLKKIAEVSGGMYQPLGAQAAGLNVIYEQGLAGFKRGDLSARETKVPLERFQWPLAAALLCLMADWMIGGRRRAPAASGVVAVPPLPAARPAPPAVPSRAVAGAGAAAAVALAVLAPPGARAATPQSAEQAYQQGDYSRAHQDYAATAAKEPGRPELQFNTGSAAYKAGDYSQAVAGFQESLKNAPVAVQQDAYYNLGNTQYRLGQKTLQEKPEETIKTWEAAVNSYEAALQINPSDPAAKHNRDLVRRKIEQLKKQQEEKKNQQDQDQKDKDNSQDPKDQKDSKDQQQSGDSKDGQGKDQKDPKDQDSKDSKDGKNQDQEQKQDQNQQSGGGKENGDQQEKNKSQDQQDQKGNPDKDKDQNQEPRNGGGSPESGGQDPQDQNQKDDQSPDGKKPEKDPDSQEGGKDAQDGAQDKDKDKDGKPDSGEDKEGGEAQNGEPQQDKDKSKDKAGEQDRDKDGKPDKQPGDDPKNESKDNGKEPGKAGGAQPQAVNPDQKPRQGDIQPANGAPPPPSAEEAAVAADRVRAAPGQMTREEARQLLEALRNDERRVPAISAQGRAGSPPINRGKIKDW